MLLLINTNRMLPPIAPVGLDYVAGAARRAAIDTEVLDLCLTDQPDAALADCLARTQPELIGLSLRNTDDCFWPSAAWFVPEVQETIAAVRRLSDAPIVLGGVGFSIFARQIMERIGADYGIRGDGEQAIVELYAEIRGERRFDRVPGLLWRNETWHANPPAWPPQLDVPTQRDAIDNATYFRRGGQIGVETKRGCGRQCLYCADPLAKGAVARRRDASGRSEHRTRENCILPGSGSRARDAPPRPNRDPVSAVPLVARRWPHVPPRPPLDPP